MMEAKRRSANRIGRYERVRRSGNALRPLLGRQRDPCHVPWLLRRMEGEAENCPTLPARSRYYSHGWLYRRRRAFKA